MELRKVKRVEKDNTLTEIEFKDIKAGDKFTLSDIPSDLPLIEDGTKVYIAIEDSVPCEPEGNYSIRANDYPEQA